MRVRIIQMEVTSSAKKNSQKAVALANKSQEAVDVIIFPEMFICGFDDPSYVEEVAIEYENSSFLPIFFHPFTKLSKKMNCYVILGSLPIRYQSQENLYNTSLVLSPEGQVIYNYDKSNLFPLMNEAKIFSAGSFNNVPIENSFFSLSNFSAIIRICYDLRFPEIFRYPEQGLYPEIIFLPMQWPSPRTEIFKNLAKARAIENQAYVIVCNRVGKDRYNHYEGGSLLAGPDGTIITEMNDQEGYQDVVLDFQKIQDFRSHYPFLKNFSTTLSYSQKTKELFKQE